MAKGRLNKKKGYVYNGKQVFQYWATIPEVIIKKSRIKVNTWLKFEATKDHILIMPELGDKVRGKMNRRGVYQYKGKQVFQYWITIPRKIKQESRIKTNTILKFQVVPGYIAIMPDENNEN